MQCSEVHPEHGQCEIDWDDHRPGDSHVRATVDDGRESIRVWWRNEAGVLCAYFKQRCAECHYEFVHVCADGTTHYYGDAGHQARHDGLRRQVDRCLKVLEDFEEHRWDEWLAMWGGIGEVAAEVAAVQLDDRARGLVA